jgi:hypothetical protein
MLLHYHSHREELEGLAAADPRVRVGLTAIEAPAEPGDDRQAVVGTGIEVLRAVRAGAGPELRDAIDETLPQLERRAGMTHDEFIADLSR